MSTEEIFRSQLLEQLATAAELMRNMATAAAAEANTQELLKYAEALHERANVILGGVSRWELLERQTQRIREREHFSQ